MEKTIRLYGLVAGIALLVMAMAAGFSYGYVQNTLVVETALDTLQSLQSNKTLFLSGLSGWVLIFITDLLVTWSLYIFYSKTNKRIAEGTALFRLIYTFFLGAAIVQLINVIPLINLANEATSDLLAQNVSQHFQKFEDIWSIGLIIFGFHLIGLGILSLKSRYTPDLLAYLLIFGGVCYSILNILLQGSLVDEKVLEKTESILAAPMALSELSLAVWLIYNGINKKHRKTS